MPTTGQISLLIVSIGFFLIGGGISLSRLWIERPWSRLSAKACLWSGVAVALALLVWHSIWRGSWVPLEDNFDALIWLAVVLAIFVMYVQRRKPLGGLDWFIMPIVVLLLIAAAVVGLTNPHRFDVGNAWTWVHLATTLGGGIFFAIAAATGAMYLVANYRLRHKTALAGPSLGSLERLENFTLTAVTVGFALLTMGALTGFAKMKFDHRPIRPAEAYMSLCVWIVYAIVLHSPMNPSFRGRRAAMLSIFGFVLMAGTIVAVLLMPETK